MWYPPEITNIDRGSSQGQYWYSVVDINIISNSSIVKNHFISSPEPKAHWWAYRIGKPLSSTLFKPLGRLKPNFILSRYEMGERKFVQMVLVTWPRWLPCPYMVKTLKKSSSPESKAWWPGNLVCSIGFSSTTKFVQMMTLGWPWPILRQGQIWFLMLLYGKKVKQWIFQKLLLSVIWN